MSFLVIIDSLYKNLQKIINITFVSPSLLPLHLVWKHRGSKGLETHCYCVNAKKKEITELLKCYRTTRLQSGQEKKTMV